MQQLEKLDKLQELINLEHLNKLSSYNKIKLSNKSYNNAEITTQIDKTIIYLDPPYKNTGEYQEKLNQDELKDYILNSKYKIYMSSYKCDYMQKVKSWKHRSILSAKANNEVEECLFCNRYEAKERESLFD